MTFIGPELKLRNPISVSRDTEDAFGFCPTESEDSVGEEGQDDRNLLLGICPLLQPVNNIQSLSKYGWVESGVL